MSESIKRGDIYYADLSPVVGSEQDGVRPVLVVSNNIGNHTSKTVIVVPITSKPKNKHHIPTHVHIFLCHKKCQPSIALAEQIRTIDKSRLKEFVCSMADSDMKKINEALTVSIALKEVI